MLIERPLDCNLVTFNVNLWTYWYLARILKIPWGQALPHPSQLPTLIRRDERISSIETTSATNSCTHYETEHRKIELLIYKTITYIKTV